MGAAAGEAMNENRGVMELAEEDPSLTSALLDRVAQEIAREGGWIGFDRFMQLALYQPGLGYYANRSRKFGAMPGSGSDFVTAPEMTPLFGQCLALQVAQALAASATDEIWEFGAGSGALAQQLLGALQDQVKHYVIVELSGELRARQQAALAAHAGKLRWIERLPERIEAVVLGNEVLDAMPVKLLVRLGGHWHERGVRLAEPLPRELAPSQRALAWDDRPSSLRPPVEIPGEHDYLTELHPQAEAFMRTLAARLARGAAFFIDYGFPEHEYYHPQRSGGTLMCHRGHRVDADPLVELGLKDITAHVNFSALALAAQDAGLSVLGYTGQGRFLLNCGLPALLEHASLAERSRALRLVNEHEMGELFKVIGFGANQQTVAGAPAWDAMGFAVGDRSHRL
jgi:SAM-dependent MidA family methyltransferase